MNIYAPSDDVLVLPGEILFVEINEKLDSILDMNQQIVFQSVWISHIKELR